MKLTEYAGRKNVLMTHPFNEQRGASLERRVKLPAGAPEIEMMQDGIAPDAIE